MLHLLLLLLLGLASAFVFPVTWSIRRVPQPPGRAWMLLLLLILQMLLYELLRQLLGGE
jgi:NADH:ubiquinone oxidoreductase subunit 3 (subunit A)